MALLAAYAVPHPPLIVPEVGRGQERRVQRTIDAYHKIAEEIGALAPETILVLTPHSVLYSDYIHISPGKGAAGDLGRFGAGQVSLSVDYDTPLVSLIEELNFEAGIPAGTQGERDPSLDHGILVPLYFLRERLPGCRIVRISVSGLTPLEHYRFGICIQKSIEKLGRRAVLIASGDLSHRLKEEGPYDFAEEGPQFDRQITQAMARGDFLQFLQFEEGFCEAAGECGLRSFQVMAGALDGLAVQSELLSYEGPFGVGYAVSAYRVTGLDPKRRFDLQYQAEQKIKLEQAKDGEDDYVKLARLSLETFLLERKNLKRPQDLPGELLDQKAGVFVSLKKHGRLRGCIGTIAPVEENVADEIIRNAVSAGVGDPRFDPVAPEELPELTYSVDVLGKPEPIAGMDQLDVKRYGVIVTRGRKRGLLLPNLDGVTSPAQQVQIALQKAGISPEEQYAMERFEVVRHL